MVSMRTPEVVDGYRTPRGDQRPKRGTGEGQREIPAGKTLIQFNATRYRLQLTNPEPVRLSNGSLYNPKGLVVVADQGFKLLDNEKDAEAIARIKGGTATVKNDRGEMVEETFEPHVDYGKDFHDFSETLARAKKEQVDQALKTLEDPEQKARILAALAASGEVLFPVPAAQPPKGEEGAGEGAGEGAWEPAETVE